MPLGRSGSAVEFLSSGSRDQQRLALVRSRLQRFLQRGEGGAGGEGNHRARRDDVAWPAWDRLHQARTEGFADSVIADMVGMSIAMVQRYTRFEDKRVTGKSVLALLAARKIGTAIDPATPNCKTLENVKRYPLKTLRKIWHCRMSAFRRTLNRHT